MVSVGAKGADNPLDIIEIRGMMHCVCTAGFLEDIIRLIVGDPFRILVSQGGARREFHRQMPIDRRFYTWIRGLYHLSKHKRVTVCARNEFALPVLRG